MGFYGTERTYDDNDVTTWFDIDPEATEPDLCARQFVAEEIAKTLEIAEDNNDYSEVPTTDDGWLELLGEELDFQLRQGDWLTDDNFDAICDKVDEVTPIFLDGYENGRLH